MARRDDRDDSSGITPGLDDGDQALITRLRALPLEGREPDWRQLEHAIRAQVHALPSPLPWWRNWRFLVPIGALAATAAAALLVIGNGHRAGDPAQSATRVTPHDAAVVEPALASETAPAAPAVWLDGEATELDETAALEALEELAGPAGLDDTDDADAPAAAGQLDAQLVHDEPDADEPGILPGTDYGWIDTLDDEAMGRAETWLARKRS